MEQHLSAYHQLDMCLLRGMAVAAPAAAREACGYQIEEHAGALIASAAHEPGVNANRTIGLAQLPLAQSIKRADRAIDLYEQKGIQQYFLQLGPSPAPELTKHLEGRGLSASRAWQLFQRNAVLCAPTGRKFELNDVDRTNAPTFGTIATACFGLGSAFQDIVESALCLPNWHGIIAFVDSRPAGCACLLANGEAGMLIMGGTLPEFRGRGIQQALIAARIQKAHSLGLQKLFTGTGVAVPGEPQHSYRNIERAGFEPLCLQQNYAPHQATAVHPSGH